MLKKFKQYQVFEDLRIKILDLITARNVDQIKDIFDKMYSGNYFKLNKETIANLTKIALAKALNKSTTDHYKMLNVLLEKAKLSKQELDNYLLFCYERGLDLNCIVLLKFGADLGKIHNYPGFESEFPGFICRISRGADIQKIIFEKYPEFIKYIENPNEELKAKYSHKLLGGKFGVFEFTKTHKIFEASVGLALQKEFRSASEENKIETIKRLLKKGINVRKEFNKILMDSAWNGELDLIKFLVDNGADFRAEDDAALGNAAYVGALEVVKYLVEKGSQLDMSYMKLDETRRQTIRNFIDAVGDTVNGQEQIITKYPKYIHLLDDIKPELKSKYSHKLLANKFGLLDND